MEINLKELLLVVLMATSCAGSGDNCNLSPITNCQLFNFTSDIVTSQDMQDQDAMDITWAMIYYSEFDPDQTYGKCNFRWNSTESDIITRELVCYHIDDEECKLFKKSVTWDIDSCGRLEEKGVNETMDVKFYSQDLTNYFWYDSCYNYTTSGECNLRYLNLLIRDTRNPDQDDQQQEIDLQGLPWDRISADLKINFNIGTSDLEMKFSWKGPECGFDGNVKTSSA